MGRCELILIKGSETAAMQREEMRERRNKRRAEREERSTVMRSQMLLISCAAVRVPAIATMSHSAGKQRERLRKPKPQRGTFPLLQAQHSAREATETLCQTCTVFLRKARLQVHLSEITANLEEVQNGAAACLRFHFPKRIKRLKY